MRMRAACLLLAARAPLANVVLIIVDNLRPALGAYGDTLAVTPEMDALASGGTVFALAHAQIAGLCIQLRCGLRGKPSRRRGYEHGAVGLDRTVLWVLWVLIWYLGYCGYSWYSGYSGSLG